MPKFLEDKPTSDDTLGQVHKKLTDTLEIIIDNLSNNNSIKNIIGLFGSWGSGKSSLIKMLDEKEDKENNKKYEILEFDSWSHKDEFLKRAFLIELALKTDTFNDSVLKEDNFKKYENFEIGEILNNNIKNQVIRNENKIQVNGLTITLFLITIISLIGINISDIIVELLSYIPFNIILNYNTNFNPYILLFIGVFCCILIILIIYYIKCYFSIFVSYIKEEINKIFNYFVIKRVDFEENKVKSEGVDFTNYDYQEIFKLIIKKYFYHENKKKLIIVLDNLDRVNDDIVLNSISLIQTTLEGINEELDNEGKNIFDRLIFILPIDKDRLKNVFEKLLKEDNNKEEFTEGFIDKTFSVIVDVPSLEQSDWREYFKLNINLAFHDFKIEDEDVDELTSNFYSYVSNSRKIVTPREIINFINELVSNYLYWGENIKFLKQGEYILFKRYKLSDSEKWENWIRENGKYAFNIDIVKQFYKTEDIYDILYLDEIVKSLQEGNIDDFNENYNKIDHYSNKNKLLENAYDKILKSKDRNIKIIGNMVNVIFENNSIPNIYKNRLQNDLNDEFGYYSGFVEKIDVKSSKGILKVLDKYSKSEIKFIKEKLPKTLIDTVILSNKSKEDE